MARARTNAFVLPLIALGFSVAGPGGPMPLGGQAGPRIGSDAVVGRVVDAATGEGIGGATVLHLDTDAGRLSGAFTASDGSFTFRVDPIAGHRVRVERLGYAPLEYAFETTPDPDGGPVVLRITQRPIALDAITVSADRACEVSPEEGDETYLLWEAARTGLRAAELTESEALISFRVTTWIRDLDREGNTTALISIATTEMTGVPFGVADPADLVRAGYVREEGDTLVAYGPDARILLSQPFLETHCFEAFGRHPLRDEEIGLRFRPLDGRTVTDIEGVLWLDVASGELRSVHFDYVRDGVPFGSGATGFIEFRVLEDGPWIVDGWLLRMPLGDRDDPLHIRERSGTVISVSSGSGGAQPPI